MAKYSNADSFYTLMCDNFKKIGKKYNIKSHSFDLECIDSTKDLVDVISTIIKKLTPLSFELIDSKIDTLTDEHTATFRIRDEIFTFSSSCQSDWLSSEALDILFSVPKKLGLNELFYSVNPYYDQTLSMIFTNYEILKLAVDEGYPCNLKDVVRIAKYRNRILHPDIFPIVTMSKIPSFDEIKKSIVSNLQSLIKERHNVPNLTAQRIYVTDLYDEGKIEVFIDGFDIGYPCEIVGTNQVRTFYNMPFSVFTCYCLVNDFNGKIDLIDRNEKIHEISNEDFKQEVIDFFR